MRKREFSTGRWCVHHTLESIGKNVSYIGIGEGGEPLLLESTRESISHRQFYCPAVVCSESEFSTIGIDMEENVPLPDGVLQLICSQKKAHVPSSNFKNSNVHWGKLYFLIKESLIKAYYMQTRMRISFNSYLDIS